MSSWVRSTADMEILIRDRGTTKAALAGPAKVTREMISQVVSGKKGCSMEVAESIVRSLGGPLEYDMLFETRVRRSAAGTAMPATSTQSVSNSSSTDLAVA